MRGAEDTQTSVRGLLCPIRSGKRAASDRNRVSCQAGHKQEKPVGTTAAQTFHAKRRNARTTRVILKQVLNFFRRKKAAARTGRIRDHQLGQTFSMQAR